MYFAGELIHTKWQVPASYGSNDIGLPRLTKSLHPVAATRYLNGRYPPKTYYEALKRIMYGQIQGSSVGSYSSLYIIHFASEPRFLSVDGCRDRNSTNRPPRSCLEPRHLDGSIQVDRRKENSTETNHRTSCAKFKLIVAHILI